MLLLCVASTDGTRVFAELENEMELCYVMITSDDSSHKLKLLKRNERNGIGFKMLNLSNVNQRHEASQGIQSDSVKFH